MLLLVAWARMPWFVAWRHLRLPLSRGDLARSSNSPSSRRILFFLSLFCYSIVAFIFYPCCFQFVWFTIPLLSWYIPRSRNPLAFCLNSPLAALGPTGYWAAEATEKGRVCHRPKDSISSHWVIPAPDNENAYILLTRSGKHGFWISPWNMPKLNPWKYRWKTFGPPKKSIGALP
ncbi:hypothetical protein VTO42DRAFT_1780 [Malbranchea cinnamomea]